jgi:hypothetical protein
MPDNGPRIFFTISAHGFGHLTQSAALINTLLKQYPDSQFYIECNLPKDIIASRLDCKRFDHDQTSSDIGMIQHDPMTVDLPATYQAYRALHDNYKERIDKQAGKMDQWRPDLVISDIPYLSFASAAKQGISSVALASLSWDHIIAEYFNINSGLPRKWYQDAYQSYGEAELALLPDPAMDGDCFHTIKRIPPIALLGKRQSNLRSMLSIDKADNRPLVLNILGGIPGAQYPVSMMQNNTEFHWLINQNADNDSTHIHHINDCQPYNFKDIIASADAVISKPGYGIAVESAAYQLPFFFIRRGHFPDESCIIDWLYDNTMTKEISLQDWQTGSFIEDLKQALSLPKKTPNQWQGAAAAAAIIKNKFLS